MLIVEKVSVASPVLHSYPIVSVIIPCRNERTFITPCLDSVIESDFPKDRLEILVVDGMSEDGTREILGEYSREYAFLSVLDNSARTTPAALNIGIRQARGSIVMRMDAHSRYDKQYISRCVEALGKHSADCVGGIWKIVPRTPTLFGFGVAQALSHPFGIGNAPYRYAESREPQWVDTVPYFCMRKWKFTEVGLFNESLARGEDMEFHLRLNQTGLFNEKLTRGQDMEFSLRLKKAGGRTLLLPDIVSYYYARSDPRSFWKHNWTNGVWAILPFAYSHIMPVAGRHLVPLAFVTSILFSLVLGLWSPPFLFLLGAILAAYGLLTLAASVHVAWKQRNLQYCLIMPIVFMILHVSYGLGSVWGVIRLLGLPEFWKKLGWYRLKHASGQ